MHLANQQTETTGPAESSLRILSEQVRSDADFLERLIEVLREETKSQRRRTKLSIKLTAWIGGSVLAVVLGALLYAWLTGNWRSIAFLGFSGFTGFLGFLSFLTLASKRHKEVARVVAQSDDIRALGPLIDSMNIQDPRINAEVMRAVTRLLPRLDEQNASLLSVENIDVLNNWLNRTGRLFAFRSLARNQAGMYIGRQGDKSSDWVFIGGLAGVRNLQSSVGIDTKATPGIDMKAILERQDDFLLATVQASPSFGNSKTLRHVERIARTHPSEAIGQRLKEAANSVLPALRARVGMLNTGDHLLRPAEPFESNTLLRPASGAPSTDESQLLRPVDES